MSASSSALPNRDEAKKAKSPAVAASDGIIMEVLMEAELYQKKLKQASEDLRFSMLVLVDPKVRLEEVRETVNYFLAAVSYARLDLLRCMVEAEASEKLKKHATLNALDEAISIGVQQKNLTGRELLEAKQCLSRL